MKTKKEIVTNWLPRYTGTPLKGFGKYILLVNFEQYLNTFSEWYNVPINGLDKPMPNVTAEGITLINFGMGSASFTGIETLSIDRSMVTPTVTSEGAQVLLPNWDLILPYLGNNY